MILRNLSIIISLLIQITQAQPVPNPPTWQTLSGKSPLVIARGGLSGVYPDSSDPAFSTTANVSLQGTVLFCDLQLTKDLVPFCLTEIRLDQTTNIANVIPKGQKTYNVNGKDVAGWFSMDFTFDELFPKVSLIQSTLTRTDMFDNLFPIVTLEALIENNPAGLKWLNVEYDTFYNQHRINPANIIETYPNLTSIQYISSTEIGFLKFINPKIDKTKTKLIFKFLQPIEVEPTTRKSYSDILKDLATIKEFASGFLVPKDYIVPISKDMYLEAPTNLVSDAHKLGIEVFASGFANDMPTSYNYSYDPTLEYLQFVDNSKFSVDGVLTDFAGTASEAIACIAHNKNPSKPQQGKALIISHNGASGDYAPCTDLAYEKAVNDGADIIDCSVQMSKDGVMFCSPSADITISTTAFPALMSQATKIPEIQEQSGVFSFNLAWSEIQALKPQIISPIANMTRNPAAKNEGKLLTLAEFLDLAKKKAVSGILINIENAAYLASKKKLDITNGVASALKNATLDKQSTQKVLIQSAESSVLAMFKDSTSYKKVYTVTANGITTIDEAAVKEIKKVADTVNLPKSAFITESYFVTLNDTHLVKRMHDANITVYAYVMYNEFTTFLFDMFADPLVNLATFIKGLGVDGVVTDYPATARNYLKSPCVEENAEYWIKPTEIGQIFSTYGPPPGAGAPLPAPLALTAAEVVGPPLPSVSATTPSSPSGDKKSASTKISVGKVTVCIVSILVFILGNH